MSDSKLSPRPAGEDIGRDAGINPRFSGWTYLEARVPRELEHELYDMIVAKIKEKGYKK